MTRRGQAPASEADKFLIRLPDGLRDEVKAAADANNRSMNAEIVARIERKDIVDDLDRRVSEHLEAIARRMAQTRETVPSTIDPDLFGRLHAMAEKAFETSGGENSCGEVSREACLAYNDLVDQVSDLGDTEEVEAYLPAVGFRMARRIAGTG